MLANLLVQLLTKNRNQVVVDWVVSRYPEDRVVRANYSDGVAKLQTASGKEIFLDSAKLLKLLRRSEPKWAVPVLFVLGRCVSQGATLDFEITQEVAPTVHPYLLFWISDGEIKFSSIEGKKSTGTPLVVPSSEKLRNRLSDFLGRYLT